MSKFRWGQRNTSVQLWDDFSGVEHTEMRTDKEILQGGESEVTHSQRVSAIARVLLELIELEESRSRQAAVPTVTRNFLNHGVSVCSYCKAPQFTLNAPYCVNCGR